MINEQSSINKENTNKMDIKQKSKKELKLRVIKSRK